MPQEQKEELREQLIRTLDVIQDPKTPPKERAAYMGIMDTVTETLKVIHDPKTGKKERETYTKIVERITETLKVIHDPKTGKKVKETYTKIVEKITETLEIIYDPKTGKKVKETYTKIVEKITETLEIILPSKIPPKELHKIEETVGDISHALVLIRAPKTPPTEQADIKKITEEISETLVEIYHPNTPPDKRAEAKKVEGSLIDELKRQIKALPKPKLVVEKKAVNSRVSPGVGQGFTIEITNRGDGEATNLALTDDFSSTGIWPIIDAQLETKAGGKRDCARLSGDTNVECKGFVPVIAPGETITVEIHGVVAVREGLGAPLGKKWNTVNVEFDQGKASASAAFTIVESPKLSNDDLQRELNAINQCAEHAPFLKHLGIPKDVLLRFVERMTDELGDGAPWWHAARSGYKEAATVGAVEGAMSLVKFPFTNISLLQLAKGTMTTADCMEFAKKALSVQ